MKKFKLDNNIIEYKKIKNNCFMIYLQYNNMMSQTNFIIDLEAVHPGFYRTFTKRQANIIINKLKKDVDQNE